MPDLSTKYLGLTLRNPLIVGACGLTSTVSRIKELEKNGAGAIVLRSIFEEEILAEYEEAIKQKAPQRYKAEYQETLDYYDYQLRAERLSEYTQLIRDSKKSVSIPVMASVSCVHSHEWAQFAKQFESAGADALELNMFFLPSDLRRNCEETEKLYLDVVQRVKNQVSIPIALKISPYFANLGAMIKKLSDTGVAGLVLFNRFWSPDFDLEKLEVVPTNVLSTPADFTLSLRWIAIMAKRVKCDLAASTGVHDGKGVIKQILAGAKAVQVVSALYRQGSAHLQTMLNELSDWMTTHEYYGLEQFRGLLSQAESMNPAVYERVQFMRYFGGR